MLFFLSLITYCEKCPSSSGFFPIIYSTLALLRVTPATDIFWRIFLVGLILILTLILMLFYIMSPIWKPNKSKKGEKKAAVIKLIKNALKFFQEIYIFGINIPTNAAAGHIFLSEHDANIGWKFLALVSFLVSIIFSNILFFSQNCMSFRVRSPLSFKLNFTLVFLLNLEIILSFSSSTFSERCIFLNGIVTIFFILLLVHAFTSFPFFSNESNIAYVSSLITGVFVAFTLFIAQSTDISEYIDLWFFFAIGVPFSIKLGTKGVPRILMRSINTGFVEGDFHSFELMIRDLCKDYLSMKESEPSKFRVLGFFHSHLKTCVDLNCLCQKLVLSGTDRSSKEYLKKTLFSIINNLFSSFTTRSRGESFENTILLHGSFLLSVEGIPNKTLCLLLGQKWKFRSVINRVKLSHMIKQTRKHLQKSISAAGGSVENFSAAVVFEEALNKIENQIFQYFGLLKELMNLIMQEEKYSTVEHFYQSASDFIDRCLLTCDSIIYLLEKNPHNNQLIELATVFSRFLLQDESLQNYLKHIVIKQLTDHLVKKKDSSIDVYDPEAGVVFISLLDPVGRIEKVTKNILSIFEYEEQEILHRDIKLLMPGVFAKDHTRYLMDFINSGQSMLLSRSSAILYGVTKRRNLKPLSIMLRIDTHFHDNFLIGGFVKPVKAYYTKAIMADKTGRILHFTRDLQEFLDPDEGLVFEQDYLNVFCLMPELLETLVIMEQGQKEEFENSISKEPVKLKTLMFFPIKFSRNSAINTLLASQRSNFKKTEFSKIKMATGFEGIITETLDSLEKLNLNNNKLFRISLTLKKESFARGEVVIYSFEITELFELKRKHRNHYGPRVIEQFRDFFNQASNNNLTRSLSLSKKRNIKERLEMANIRAQEFEMEIPDSTRPSHIQNLMMKYQNEGGEKPSGAFAAPEVKEIKEKNLLMPQISHDYDSRAHSSEVNEMQELQDDPNYEYKHDHHIKDRENSRVSTLSRLESKIHSQYQTMRTPHEDEQAHTISENSAGSEKILSKLTSSGEIAAKFQKVEGSKASSRASRNDQKTILEFLVKSERGRSRILVFLGFFLFFSFVFQLAFLVIFDISQINSMHDSLDSKGLLGMQLEGISQITKSTEELRLFSSGIFDIKDVRHQYHKESVLNSIKYNFELIKHAYLSSQGQPQKTNSQKEALSKRIDLVFMNNELDQTSRQSFSDTLSMLLAKFFLAAIHYDKIANNKTPEFAFEELKIFETFLRENNLTFLNNMLTLLDSISFDTINYFDVLLKVHDVILICFLLFVLLGIIVIIYLTFQIKHRNYKFLTLMFTFSKKLIQERVEKIDILQVRMTQRHKKNPRKLSSGMNTFVSQVTKTSFRTTKSKMERTNNSKLLKSKKPNVLQNAEHAKYGISSFLFTVVVFVLTFCLLFTAIFLSHYLFTQSSINHTKADINDKNSVVDSFVLSKIKFCLYQLQINSYFFTDQTQRQANLNKLLTTMDGIRKRERLLSNPTNFFKNDRDTGSEVNLRTKVFFMEDLCKLLGVYIDASNNSAINQIVEDNIKYLADNGLTCDNVWDGILKKGAVSFNYKVNAMLDSSKEKITSQNYTLSDLKTIMEKSDYKESSACLFFMDLININIGGQINSLIADSLHIFSQSIYIWMVVAFLVTLVFFASIWSRYTKFITNSIERTYMVIRIFPMKLIKENKVLESRIRYIVRSNMMF